jgi:GT2 family glycosyltransferase
VTSRDVTAVVLLSGRGDPDALLDALAALSAQERAADRVAVVVRGALDEAGEDRIAALHEDGTIDEVLRIPAAAGLASAVREVMISLPSGVLSAVEQNDPGQAAPRAGGHMRQMDRDAHERGLVREAQAAAQVPTRLRGDGAAMGTPAEGRRRASPDSESWFWVLTEEALPGRGSLRALLDAAEASPTAAMIGSKRLRPLDTSDGPDEQGTPGGAGDDPADPGSEPIPSASPRRSSRPTADDADELLDVGLTLTHSGRIVTGIEPGEIDQGQADWRHDVLGVALPGVLVRETALARLGGTDPALGSPFAEVDLGHRVWRGGERVEVAAASRVLVPRRAAPAAQLLREHRRGQLLLLLKHRPLLGALLTLVVGIPLGTLARMLGHIAAQSPRLALAELRAALAAYRRAPGVMSRGARASRRSRVPRRRLAPLYLPRTEAARRQLEAIWTRLFADDERARRIRRTTWGIAGTTHGADDADFGRHGVWTIVLAALALIGGVIGVRPLLARGELAGPQLQTLDPDWRESLRTAWSSWVPGGLGGLGARGPGDALMRLLAPLPLPDGVLTALLVLSVPLAAMGAWWAAGALTRAVGARLALAVVWAVGPPLLASLSTGAWPLVLVHLLLPLLALAVGRAIGLVHKVSQASVSAAAAAGLVLLVIGAVQPALVVLVGLALALLAPLVPGRRWRLLWVLVPSLALHLPYLPTFLAHPSALLHVAGVPATTAEPSALELLALWPAPAPSWDALAGLIGPAAAGLLPIVLMAPVVLGALVAPFQRAAAGRAGRYALLVAALGLAVVLLARTVPTEVGRTRLLSAPVGGLLSLVLLALLIGCAASIDALARRSGREGRARRVLSSAVAGLVAVVCLVATVGWTASLPGALQVHRTTTSEVPQAARDLGTSSDRGRVLVLGEDADGTVAAHLVVDGGPTAQQASGASGARALEAARTGEAVDGDPGSTALREAAGELLTSDPASDPTRLRTLAVGYVVVPGAAADAPDLTDALDSSPQLEKVTEGSTGALWRVVDPGARAVVRPAGDSPAAEDEQTVPSSIIDASGEVPAADGERVVVLSERRDSRWEATLDDRALTPIEVDGWAQGFTVPAGAQGHLEIHRDDPGRAVLAILLAATVLITAIVAVPWRAGPERRRGEAPWQESGAL